MIYMKDNFFSVLTVNRSKHHWKSPVKAQTDTSAKAGGNSLRTLTSNCRIAPGNRSEKAAMTSDTNSFVSAGETRFCFRPMSGKTEAE